MPAKSPGARRRDARSKPGLVVTVDRAMGDAAIFEILNEVRGEEAFSDAAFAVNDEVDLFVHIDSGWLEAARVCDARTASAWSFGGRR